MDPSLSSIDGNMVTAAAENANGEQLMYTVDEALDHLGFGITQVIMFIFVGVAWAGDGMEMMLLSYLGPELKCKWDLSPAQESLITSVVFIGMMLGAYSWGAISDRYGRKIGYFAPAVFTAAFGILSAMAPSYGALLFFRACVGFGIAGAHVAYTLFLEYVGPSHRGQFLSLIEGFWTLGAVFLAGMAWVVLPARGWRALVLVAAGPLIILVAVYPFLKESPHWLFANGRVSEATTVLKWTAALNGKELPRGRLVSAAEKAHSTTGQRSLDSINDSGKEVVAGQHGIQADNRMDGFTDCGGNRNALSSPLAALWGHITNLVDSIGYSLRQMLFSRELAVTSGLLSFIWIGVALSYYGTILFGVELQTQRGETCSGSSAVISSDDFKDVFITSLGEIGSLFLCLMLVDVIGRRRCLWLFLFGVSICNAPLFRNGAPGSGEASSFVDIAALFCTRMFAYAAFITLFIYTPELYPTKIRSFSFGLFNALCRLGGLVAPFIAVDLFDKDGVKAAAGTFFVVGLLSALISMALPTETKGRGLPEDTSDLVGYDTQPTGWDDHADKEGWQAVSQRQESVAQDVPASNPFDIPELGTSSAAASSYNRVDLI